MSMDAYIILNMYKVIFVTTKNCSICEESYRKLKKFRFIFNIVTEDVTSGYEEYIFRVPLVIYRKKILEEGQISVFNLLKKIILKKH